MFNWALVAAEPSPANPAVPLPAKFEIVNEGAWPEHKLTNRVAAKKAPFKFRDSFIGGLFTGLVPRTEGLPFILSLSEHPKRAEALSNLICQGRSLGAAGFGGLKRLRGGSGKSLVRSGSCGPRCNRRPHE